MKQFIIATTLLGIATCALLPTQSPQYLPPSNTYQAGSNNQYQSPQGSNDFGSKTNNQYNAPSNQFNAPSNQYGTPSNQNQYQNNQGNQNQYNEGAQSQYQSGGAQSQYQGSQNQYQGQGGQQYRGPTEPPVPIIRLDQQNEGDGNYQYAFETGNGIQAQEQGLAHGDGTKTTGSFSYTSPEGEQIQISYNADENGYQPQGSHIPTAPPIPEEILKAIEQNAADEANGIVDDGQYRPEHEGPQDYQKSGYGFQQNNQYHQQPSAGHNQYQSPNNNQYNQGGNQYQQQQPQQQQGNQYQANNQYQAGNQHQAGNQASGNQFQGAQSNQYIPPKQGNNQNQYASNGGYN